MLYCFLPSSFNTQAFLFTRYDIYLSLSTQAFLCSVFTKSELNTSVIYSAATYCSYQNMLLKHKKESKGPPKGRTDKLLERDERYFMTMISLIHHWILVWQLIISKSWSSFFVWAFFPSFFFFKLCISNMKGSNRILQYCS